MNPIRAISMQDVDRRIPLVVATPLWLAIKATPAGSDKTPAPIIDLTRLKISSGIVAVPYDEGEVSSFDTSVDWSISLKDDADMGMDCSARWAFKYGGNGNGLRVTRRPAKELPGTDKNWATSNHVAGRWNNISCRNRMWNGGRRLFYCYRMRFLCAVRVRNNNHFNKNAGVLREGQQNSTWKMDKSRLLMILEFWLRIYEKWRIFYYQVFMMSSIIDQSIITVFSCV